MPKESGSPHNREDIRDVEPTDSRMDKLFWNRKYEGLSARIQRVDETQGACGTAQAVEKTGDYLQESTKAESVWKMRTQRRGNIQGSKLSVGTVSKKQRICNELSAESKDTWHKNKGSTRTDRPFGVLSRKMYLTLF